MTKHSKSYLSQTSFFRSTVSLTVAASFIISHITIPAQAAQVKEVRSVWALPETAGIRSSDVIDETQVDVFQGPGVALDVLQVYESPAADDPLATALTMDDMLSQVSQVMADTAARRSLLGDGLPQEMMAIADRVTSSVDVMYSQVGTMISGVEDMKRQTQSRYETFNQKQLPANDLNSASDESAQKVAVMRRDVDAMRERAVFARDLFTDMKPVLEEKAADGRDVPVFYDRLDKHVQNIRTRFDGLAKNLERSGWPLQEGAAAESQRYLDAVSQYAINSKIYVNKEVQFLQESGRYLQNAADYFGRVEADLGNVSQSLAANENYFRSAKVQDKASEDGLAVAAGGDVCAGAVDPLTGKERDLKTLQDCQKDCRTVCRWKQNVGAEHCYECPSGSPDSCWDVGAWPADHPWCAPGGVCHSDPMMVCAPVAATGPNLEKLNCTNCKQRPDMCWQKVPDNTMTWTNCKLGCWDGKCVYKGKYQEPEWDGTMENIHCFECKRPPPPPNCEDLKWGFDFKSDCENMCPAPGVCEEVNMPSGAKPKGQQQGQPGQPGEDDGGDKGPEGESEGGTSAGGDQPPPTGGKPANPPTGTPAQPGGGGAVAPSGPSSGSSSTPAGSGKTDEPAQPPKDPGTTTANPPAKPNTGGQPQPPSNPPKPPTNPDIEFYETWRAETQERIKSREAILNDPNEGEYTKDAARSQLESMTRERDYLDSRIKEKQAEELERQRQAEEARKRQEEWEKTRPKHVDYGEEMRTREREWKLNKLKEATDALTSKLREAQEILTGRRERIEKVEKEIALLESEIKYMTEAAKEGRLDEDFAETQTRERQKRLKDLKDMRNQFIKKMNELQAQYQEELEALRSEYQRRLWSVDENARRKADTQRMDEYFGTLSELHRREQSREQRQQTFESMVKSLEGALAEARASGDDDRAEELERQIDNVKRTQAEWDAAQERQIESIKTELLNLEYRNLQEGAGPSSPESLARKFDEYEKIFNGKIAETDQAIARLESLGSARTAEQNKQLQDLKAQRDGISAAIEGLQAKRQDLAAGNPLTSEERQLITDSTTRVAAGSMNQDADKSFLRLAGESLVEEAVHNMNPLVAAKKSIAFGWGMAKGVGSAVVGLVDLGVEAVDTLAEAAAVNAGFEDGGIFGTDNLDTINSAISGVSNNMNFDGAIKAVVAVGGAIDAEINRLAKSKDIDWATAELGGRVAGEVVLGDAVIAGAISKAGTVLRGVDTASDIARAADKAIDVARAADAAEDVSAAGRIGSMADDVPTGAPKDMPSTRAPPPDGTPTVRDTFNPPPDDSPTQIGGFEPVDRGATTVRDPNLAGTLDDAPTVRDFNPPPDNSPTQIGGFKPGVADDAPTQVGGFRPDEDDLKTAVGGFKPGSVVDETPTQIGGLKPGVADDAPTQIGGIKPGVADDAPTQAGGFRPDQDDIKTNVGRTVDDAVPPPPPTIKPTPASVIGENRALGYVDAAGNPVTLQTGQQLGKGSTSTVFVDASNPKRAIRVTDIGGEVAQAPQLDKIGRETVQTVQDGLGKNSPIRVVEQHSITRVNDPNSPLNNKMVEIVETMDQGSAKKVLERQGGAMTSGQAKAFNDATKALNDKGYAWLDNHTGNYTFEPMPGGGPDDWRVVVIDPGGIAPMKGATLAEKADNARAIQGMINAPEAGFTDYWNKVKNADGRFKDAVLGERWGEIIGKHGDNINIGAMGLDDVNDVKFNPGGTLNHPQAQSLFGQ